MPTLLLMPPRKKPAGKDSSGDRKESGGDRHKPRRMAAIPLSMAAKLDDLVKLNGSDFTEEVRNAVREYLQRHGLWPKKPGDPSGGD